MIYQKLMCICVPWRSVRQIRSAICRLCHLRITLHLVHLVAHLIHLLLQLCMCMAGLDARPDIKRIIFAMRPSVTHFLVLLGSQIAPRHLLRHPRHCRSHVFHHLVLQLMMLAYVVAPP